MKNRLKIVVGGYAVGFPMGGQLWMILQYLLGLSRMGHEVLFIEDTDSWAFPFDPARGHHLTDSSFGRANLDKLLSRYGLGGRWSYYSMFENRRFGVGDDELRTFCDQADLFLNISGVIPLREQYLGARVRAIVDTNPVLTQCKIERDDFSRDYYARHDFHFTFGENLTRGAPPVPMGDFTWHATRPPIVLSEWSTLSSPGTAYSTIGSWDCETKGLVVGGEAFTNSRAAAYEAILDIPKTLPEVNFEVCFSGMKEDEKRLAQHGWRVKDALVHSRDPWLYRDYIHNSRAEFTVARDINVRFKSGWFSERSAAFLASGRPVLNQDTGFDAYLPTGEGLLSFNGHDEIAPAIERIERDYGLHSKAARRVAEVHFDAHDVLGGILKTCQLA